MSGLLNVEANRIIRYERAPLRRCARIAMTTTILPLIRRSLISAFTITLVALAIMICRVEPAGAQLRTRFVEGFIDFIVARRSPQAIDA